MPDQQENYGAWSQPYLVVWQRVLRDWLRWSPDRIARWMAAFHHQLYVDGSMFTHESPFWYVVPLLIPDALKRDMGVQETVALENAIHRAFHLYPGCDEDPAYDWDAAKQRIQTLLRTAGSNFPESSEMTEYEVRVLTEQASANQQGSGE